MARCKYCGAEYFSGSDRCFACGQKEESTSENAAEPRRRWWLITVGLCAVVMGGILSVYAANEAFASDQVTHWPPERVDWAGLSVFGLLILSVGVGVAAFSLLSVDYPLWAIHGGAEPSQKRSAALVAIGLFALVFEAGYVVAALAFGLHVSWEVPSVLLAWTFVAITAGVFRSPPMLFGHDEELPSRLSSAAAGTP